MLHALAAAREAHRTTWYVALHCFPSLYLVGVSGFSYSPCTSCRTGRLDRERRQQDALTRRTKTSSRSRAVPSVSSIAKTMSCVAAGARGRLGSQHRTQPLRE